VAGVGSTMRICGGFSGALAWISTGVWALAVDTAPNRKTNPTPARPAPNGICMTGSSQRWGGAASSTWAVVSLIAPNFAAVYDYPVPSFGLFALARMSRETFLSELRRGAKAPYAAALTFDDGYHNFADLTLPYLETARAGATVYVCTYTGWPVFDLAVDYMFWKGPAGVVPGNVIGEAEPLTGATLVERERSTARVYAFAERQKMGGAEKNSLARTLAAHLDYPVHRHAARVPSLLILD
jgi:hypothetical protein